MDRIDHPWHALSMLDRLVIIVAACTVILGCRGEDPKPAVRDQPPRESSTAPKASLGDARAPRSDAERVAVQRAKAATQKLLTTLKGRLSSVMQAEGLTAAARVCASEAQQLTQGVAKDEGVVVARSSLNLRNPNNAGPDWVTTWLRAQNRRTAESVEPAAGIVTTADGSVARFIAPIGLEPLCLNCHGPKERIPSEIRGVLEEHYPHDEATGYAIGDLRGAVYAEASVSS